MLRESAMKIPQRAPRRRSSTIAGLAISGEGADAGVLAVEPRLATMVRDLRATTARGARAAMHVCRVVVGWGFDTSIAIS